MANSATNGGSRLIRSIEGSSAASRRTSCSRCWSASLGRICVSMRKAPSDSSPHFFANSAWPPLSGLMYHVNVGGPPASSSAQADTATGARIASDSNARRVRTVAVRSRARSVPLGSCHLTPFELDPCRMCTDHSPTPSAPGSGDSTLAQPESPLDDRASPRRWCGREHVSSRATTSCGRMSASRDHGRGNHDRQAAVQV